MIVIMSAPAPSLAGHRVLVVGASAGIGRATGVATARAGAHVALAARRLDLLREVVEQIGPVVFPVHCDVREPSACAEVVR